MRPEDWLREQGIDIKRVTLPTSGDLAGQATEALPIVPPAPITELATERMPAVGDIATLPTGRLESHDDELGPEASAADVTTTPTEKLPQPDISATPTRRLPL